MMLMVGIMFLLIISIIELIVIIDLKEEVKKINEDKEED